MDCVLGLDVGTGSAKALVLGADGAVRGQGSASYPLLQPHPGWAEQEPEAWWQGACQAVRQALEQVPGGAAAIGAVGFSGQLNGAVFVDAAGRALGPAPLWLDHRSQPECDWANERAGDLFEELAYCQLGPAHTLAKLVWARKADPERFRQTRTVVMAKDWVRWRLTGELGTDRTDASVTAAYNLIEHRWAGEIMERLELDAGLLPSISEPTDIVGPVTEEGAQATGLRPGTPVSAGGGDMPCMVLGSGIVEPGIIGMGIGTAGHAIAFAERLDRRAYGKLWPMAHALPGRYAWLGCSFTGGACFSWLRDLFGGDYQAMTAAAAEVPPGAEGLFFLPWLEGAGTPHPDVNARGGFIGLTLRHGRGHMARAVMEGVVYDLRQALDCFVGIGLPVEQVRIGEGGSRSPLWCQIQADVFGRPVRRLASDDLSAVGAAILAGVGNGLFADLSEGCARAVALAETIEPQQADFYSEAYQRFGQLYPALKAWYAQEV